MFTLQAQNIELRNGTDITQPGQINPALAGLQEDFFRLLTNADLNNYTFMIEGKIPLKLGNYMLGVDRISNDYISNSMFNLTYGRTSKQDKKLSFRYGGSLQINTRKSLNTEGNDSTGFSFIDLNGEKTEFSSLSDLTGELSYFNLDFGASMQYNDLLVSLSLDNILNPNVSLVEGQNRALPFSANVLVGGFLNIGKNYTFFPSAMAIVNQDGFFAKAGLDFNTPYFNISGAYIKDDIQTDIKGSLAMHYKKMYFGLVYSQPIEGMNSKPTFRIFLNSSLFKDRKLFKSNFAKEVAKFY